jgi:hypothetical protein
VPHNGKELPGFDEWDWEGKLLGQQHDEELPNLEKSKGFTRDPVRVVCCCGIWYGCWGAGKWRRSSLQVFQKRYKIMKKRTRNQRNYKRSGVLF